MEFKKKVQKKWKEKKYLCIGLDPVLDKIPKSIKGKDKVFQFNRAIIDATADIVCAYKPNSAFYEAMGASGIEQLKKTCDYINKKHPDIAILLDAKRADIDSTNEGYVTFVFDYLKVDAVTLHPYLGYTSLKPFLDRKEKCLIILCRTSNIGAGEFQDLLIKNKPLYEVVAERVSKSWNKNNNVGFVVGATYPKEMKTIRRIAKEMPILIPGIGAQGGDLVSSIKSAKKNFLISSSRGIIYASRGKDFAKAARKEAEQLHNEIKQYINE